MQTWRTLLTCATSVREIWPQACLGWVGIQARWVASPLPSGLRGPMEGTVTLHGGWLWPVHPSLLKIINWLLVPSKEVILLFLAVVPPISSIFMADSRHIEPVRGAPLPGVCPASKRRPGPHSPCSVTRLHSSLIVPLQEPSPLISFPIFAYSMLLIL